VCEYITCHFCNNIIQPRSLFLKYCVKIHAITNLHLKSHVGNSALLHDVIVMHVL
jgi:hypothetical protein